MFKRLVSCEPIPVRQIYDKPFVFTPEATLWWSMNEMPANQDRSDAVYRRIIAIPFTNQVAESQIDYSLDDKIALELPGIFNWSLVGRQRLGNQNRFTMPQVSSAVIAQYKSMNDTEAEFLNDAEWCRLDPDALTKSSVLYGAYSKWCQNNGIRPVASRQINWERLGLTKLKRSDANYLVGVTITESAQQLS